MIVSFSVKRRDVEGSMIITSAKEFVIMNSLPSFSYLILVALNDYLEAHTDGDEVDIGGSEVKDS